MSVRAIGGCVEEREKQGEDVLTTGQVGAQQCCARTKSRARSAGFAVGWGGGEGFGEIFGAGGIGIELEDAGDVGTGFIELAGVAGDVGQVHADGAAAGSATERVLPEGDGAVEVTGARFDDAEICGGVDQFWIGLQGVFVECAGFCGVAAALGDESEAVEQDGIVGVFDDGLIDVALGFDGGGAVAFLRDGFPGEGEIAGVAYRRGRW